MKYHDIEKLSTAEVEAAILRNKPIELSTAVLSAALYADRAEWAQGVCERLAPHSNENVRGNAILGFGHVARINGKLTKSRVRPLIEAALQDDSEYVRGQAEAAADDVELFLRWRLNRK
jgi:hypothetical protein